MNVSKGQRLDKLLSTADDVFNKVVQNVIWENTPKGYFVPDDAVIEYMESLHRAYFFCRDHYKTPYACLDYLTEIATDDNYLLCLIDGILHLITHSDEGDKMLILYGILIDLRHELAPWTEDEGVKTIMKDMEEQKWKMFPRPPLKYKSIFEVGRFSRTLVIESFD